jgi:hypothetical protein
LTRSHNVAATGVSNASARGAEPSSERSAARTLLTIVDREPEAVNRALGD